MNINTIIYDGRPVTYYQETKLSNGDIIIECVTITYN